MKKKIAWIKDQERYDATGEQPEWRSQNPLVPPEYRLDLEYNCFTNAWNLHAMTGYAYVEGQVRGNGEGWGDHAWCVTPDGKVVDPYFEWKFPAGEPLQYRNTDEN